MSDETNHTVAESLAADLARIPARVVSERAQPPKPEPTPVGVDVAGPIMDAVEQVTRATITRLEGIIARCQDMIAAIHDHQRAVATGLTDRDQHVRALLKHHAGLARMVDDECGRAEKSLEAIDQLYKTDPPEEAAQK